MIFNRVEPRFKVFVQKIDRDQNCLKINQHVKDTEIYRTVKIKWNGSLRACKIPRSVSKTVINFFHYGLHLRPKKKATRAAEMMSVERVAIFWVVNASSGEKSCLQFSIPTGSGAGGEGGVSHSLKNPR